MQEQEEDQMQRAIMASLQETNTNKTTTDTNNEDKTE